VIDGLALPAFTALEEQLHGAIGLIHHPLCLETGLGEAHCRMLSDIELRLFPRLMRLIVTSPNTAETLIGDFGIPGERVRTVVPGTDDASRCVGSAGATREILSVGTLIPRKGHDVLLRAFSGLSDLDWRLTIVGATDREPVHAQALMALAEAVGIADRVRFSGELVGEALERVWRSADFFTLATWYEGYGMAIAEALKRGLPVVVTDGGAAGALVSSGAGRICSVGDHEALSRALRDLIAAPEHRRRMAERAWQIGQTLPSWQAQAMLFASALA
jgi:glycosyltransferase involved in cell wall biosynthesis